MKKFVSLLLVGIISVTSFASWVSATVANSQYNQTVVKNTQNIAKITIYKHGVKINGAYYTKAEFNSLLRSAQKISPPWMTRAAFLAPAIPAWTYWVAGIGAVTISYGRELIVTVGGTVVNAGNWVYNSVVSFLGGLFASKAEKYEKAKSKWEPTDKRTTKKWRVWDADMKWEAYSSQDLYHRETWQHLQRRYYDENGNPDMDIDYAHGNSNGKHTFPHCHYWIWTYRSGDLPCSF